MYQPADHSLARLHFSLLPDFYRSRTVPSGTTTIMKTRNGENAEKTQRYTEFFNSLLCDSL